MTELSPSEIFFKERARLLRNRSGLTQHVVAELAGISEIYYQSIEAGRRPNVSLRIIDQIASVYGLSIHEFFAPTPPAIRLSGHKIIKPHQST